MNNFMKIFCLFALLSSTVAQVTVYLLDSAISVREGEQFSLRIQQTGTITEQTNVVVAVRSDTGDFVGSSQIAVFTVGGSSQLSVTFTATDDIIPEPDETFIFDLSVIKGTATLATPSFTSVTILLNDNARGMFGFQQLFAIETDEPVSTTVVDILVYRSEGTFSRVTVFFQVNGTGENADPGVDITPAVGSIVFQDGETQKVLQLQIRPDNIPEADEEFVVFLTQASDEALVDLSRAVVIIKANDAPIRFAQDEYRVDEGPGMQSLVVTVFRGLQDDGQTIIGAVDTTVAVDYSLISKTALANSDFISADGRLTFLTGETQKTVSIQIIDDVSPEIEERFEIRLSNPTGEAIIVSPSSAFVIINGNDDAAGILSFQSFDAMPPVVNVNEDTFSQAVFTVTRSGGTFGVASVSWQLVRNDSTLGVVTNDVGPISDVLTFNPGQIEATITLTIVQDNEPEPAERYLLELIPNTGENEVKVEGLRHAYLIIEDSDNVYGMIQFAGNSQQRIAFNNGRVLQFVVERVGGDRGDIDVNMTIIYTGNQDVADILDGATDMTVTMLAGHISYIISTPILSSAFLQAGAEFQADISDISLMTVPDIAAYNSPTLGSRSRASIVVTATEANGEIGFHNTSTVFVDEPESGGLQVLLRLSREGTNGRAAIFWELTATGASASMVTAGDTGATSGTVILDSGNTDVNLMITIMADDEPEIDEEITVTLTSVAPALTQRLRSGAMVLKIMVLQNDNPGGTFQLSAAMTDSYSVNEEDQSIEVMIERVGGSLITQWLQYHIEPNGDAEFYGATSVLKFEPGEVLKTSSILAKGDNIPELAEVFHLRLGIYGDIPVVFGARTSISITVSANDDPYGVIEIAEDSTLVTINESQGSDVQQAIITVQRLRGTFTGITVMWSATPTSVNGLSSYSGAITFSDQATIGYVQLQSQPDEIPEPAQNYSVTLSLPDGSLARLGSRSKATVIITENDHLVYFVGNTVEVDEPGNVQLLVRRDGSTNHQSTVRYQTYDGTALEATQDYLPVVGTEIVFNIGQSEKSIIISILDDSFAEGDESFGVQLYQPEGDLVVQSRGKTTIIIIANDDAYGIFRFSGALSKSVEEGSTATFQIRRDGGTYGSVRVSYDIFDEVTDRKMVGGGDFVRGSHYVDFNETDAMVLITLSPRIDGAPELDKTFRIILASVFVLDGRTNIKLARLGTTNQQVLLTIVANDHPYGLFAFPATARETTIAEDYDPGFENSAVATIAVERRQGNFGIVQVMWELFSDNLVGGLPAMVDLLFVSEIPTTVSQANSKKRADTGTVVILCNGTQGSFVTVPQGYHPTIGDIRNGFSISAWIQPFANCDGYVVSKTVGAGFSDVYTLKLTTDASTTSLIFGYLLPGGQGNQQASVSWSINIQDGSWHHVLVTVDTGNAIFYMDGSNAITRSLDVSEMVDFPGVLLVCARDPGTDLYTGYLQDVRIFSRKLEQQEIDEIYQCPARLDVTPVSGLLTFNFNSEDIITIQSKQDKEEESNEVISVWLVAATGGASLSATDSSATLTVLKSDNANGIFGFQRTCLPSSATTEDVLVTCPVERGRGDDGTVAVTWMIYQLIEAGRVEATEDFINYTSVLTFLPGDRLKTLTFTVKDDTLPEQLETFQVDLVSALSADGVGTTNISGASVDPASSSSGFIIEANDHPYGLLQFSTAAAPPQIDDPMIEPASSQPKIHVKEESGVVSLLVVRAQGSLGPVTVEWRTTDGTARSSGKLQPDFVGAVSQLSFNDGQRYGYASVTILDNDIPEDDKVFFVQLLNPTGGAVIGTASIIDVVIDYSDGAYGVFQFAFDSLQMIGQETGDDGYNAVNLEVNRLQGSIGSTAVSWVIEGSQNGDLVSRTGQVSFANQQTSASLEIQIRGDTEPELDEHITVRLTSVVQGELGDVSRLAASVTILANDNPYGLFVIPSEERPIIVQETDGNIPVTIQRLHGKFGSVQVDFTTLSPTVTSAHLPSPVVRALETDFVPVQGSVRFNPGDEYAFFNVVILDDDLPERDESVFVQLTAAILIEGAQTGKVLNSPAIGAASELYGQIVITHNDNANGVLELSAVTAAVLENATSIGINVIRTGGDFGEISVKLRVLDNTAHQGFDYALLSSDVIMGDGERTKELPIELIDDRIPEQAESFSIELLNQITGGAVLGTQTTAMVIIEASDDPNGAFEFGAEGSSVDEPETGQILVVDIPIIRTGGNSGIVTLTWVATLNGQPVKSDISPTSGTVHFVSNEARRYINMTILPDTEPEETEDFLITLLVATNGARIARQKSYTLSILGNDNPHGFVQFSSINIESEERDADITQMLPLIRLGGTVGELRVYYTTVMLDLVTMVVADSGSILDYFDGPFEGGQLSGGTVADVTGETDTVQACVQVCLNMEICLSVDADLVLQTCVWFTVTGNTAAPNTGPQNFRKLVDKVATLRSVQAEPNLDYQQVNEAFVVLGDTTTVGELPVTILADFLPELIEKFQVKLTRVELIGSSNANKPSIGLVDTATITIGMNDDAYGIFRIYGNSIWATDNGQTIVVEEQEQFAVDIIVERLGGSIGDVEVTWSVDLTTSTALYNSDYIADGATLLFSAGEKQRTITVAIQDDLEPEMNETIVLSLSEPTGGATVGPDDTVTVIIEANDYVAGKLAFATTSVLATEGESVDIVVNRSLPALGTVIADWVIASVGGSDPALEFEIVTGSLQFDPEITSQLISLTIFADGTPEINEEYQVKFTRITTLDIGSTGAAVVDPRFDSCSVTIAASNEPHGVIGFHSNSLDVRGYEAPNSSIELVINRKFGVIGSVRVIYEARRGSVSPLSSALVEAEQGADFSSASGSLVIEADASSGVISVQIVEDGIPEIDEVFIVVLTSVTLLGTTDSQFPPRLDVNTSTAQVIIDANDGTKGVLKFQLTSSQLSVPESDMAVTLTVIRDQGTFGDVSAFYYAQTLVNGATLNIDFEITPQEIVFVSGEDRRTITLQILDDSDPEPNESLEIVLANPQNGVTIGIPSKAIVTILASDGASGTVNLETDEAIQLAEPEGSNQDNSFVVVKLLRGPGFFGVVKVPFMIVTADGTMTTDVHPAQGVVTFPDLESSAVLEISVLEDSVPEVEESLTLVFSRPDNGATLGPRSRRTIIVAESDFPYGLLQIYPRNTRDASITVEESNAAVEFEILRTGGLLGTISVDMVTSSQSATWSPDSTAVNLAFLQELSSQNAHNWISYEAEGSTYLVMLTSTRKGELQTGVGSDGSSSFGSSPSAVYRWQGEYSVVQTVETDGAETGITFVMDKQTYLIIANYGIKGRRETLTRGYSVNSNNGALEVIGDLPSKGAKDLVSFFIGDKRYLVVAQSEDNTGNTLLPTKIYLWDSSTNAFNPSPRQSINTRGAHALSSFEIEGKTYLAIANYYDSDLKKYEISSVICVLERNGRFALHQEISTKGARDVEYFLIGSQHFLVFANNRQETILNPQKSGVYRWDTTTQEFVLHQEIDTNRVQTVKSFTGESNKDFLVFANGVGNSQIFMWETERSLFANVWSGPSAFAMYPVIIQQPTGPLTLMAVANADGLIKPSISEVVHIRNSDFSPRTLTFTFTPDQNKHSSSVFILQDAEPEDTETFFVSLRDPIGGAHVGAANQVAVNILSNDNAHGIIEFNQDSLDRQEHELIGQDNPIQINVMRKEGVFGYVIIRWSTTGDHDGTRDITPLEGTVEFANGQSVSTISLTIKDDDVAELSEVTFIQLVAVVNAGTDLPSRGAFIGLRNVCKLTVLANDSPHGVVSWRITDIFTDEPEGTDIILTLYIVREQGMLGNLRVTYITSVDASVSDIQRAVSGQDYVYTHSSIAMAANVQEVSVDITVKQDDLPEEVESFLVNITNVQLIGEPAQPGSEPSIKNPGNIAIISIRENDNARGVVEFSVTTNIEGRLDVYEKYQSNNSVALKVQRTVGLFGVVMVTWQADPREADVSLQDFIPSSGTVQFIDGESEAFIFITILDDTVTEQMETFDVKLISVTGGATLGQRRSVRVAILKNDSPTGFFKFEALQRSVRESRSEDDEFGRVSLEVVRLQGSEGVVNVRWRLSAAAVNDFLDPMAGSLVFENSDTHKPITVTTKMDTILEGEERFLISLISADNNADISPTEGDATIIILPDSGASGVVAVLPQYRTVYIGEPEESNPAYNGQAEVVLTRGEGMYGDIVVTWSITPHDENAFLQFEGSVDFVDLQREASIIIQATDDAHPELRRTYTLQINSATGGATVSSSSNIADVVFVASDYPHGLFQFALPWQQIISEDLSTTSVVIERALGTNGQVDVSYTTWPGTASVFEDFNPTSGTVTFENGVDVAEVQVQLIPDLIPEGPEVFYFNITSVRLIIPGNNDYNHVGGLQLDMAPGIGSMKDKEIYIEKNDNAEGTIEFDVTAINFEVAEEDGFAHVPVVRRGGDYGSVGVRYAVQDITALVGIDYASPDTSVNFTDGTTLNTINIYLFDDSEMEFAEQLQVTLLETTGGALLGDRTTSLVTILKSDYPNGRFGFRGLLEILMSNPIENVEQTLTIERSGGTLGSQEIFWRIMGPNSPSMILESTNDIGYISRGSEVTEGSLIWSDGEAGQKSFNVVIKGRVNREIEKAFFITIYNVQAMPASVGNGQADPQAKTVTLTIQKFGHPNGIIRFEEAPGTIHSADEPSKSGILELHFPVMRRADTGTQGNVQVFWKITGSNVGIAPDFLHRNGSIIIADKSVTGEIIVQILPDDEPELTEDYVLQLIRVVGGAEIDKEQDTALFQIFFNDAPHGQMGILSDFQTVAVNPTDLRRYVRLNLTRYAGTFGQAVVSYVVRYDKTQSNVLLTGDTGTVLFEDGAQNAFTDIAILGDVFLEIDSTFSVTLTDVRYQGSGGVDSPPQLAPGQTDAKVVVPAIAANSKVGFQSTTATVDDETMTATVTIDRHGSYGSVDVNWRAGFPANQIPAGFLEGVMSSKSGTVSFSHGEDSQDVTLQLNVRQFTPELFGVHLPDPPITTTSGGAILRSGSTQATVEPSGVVMFASNSTDVYISEIAKECTLLVLRRFGSMDKIEVHYRLHSGTADVGLDIPNIDNNVMTMEPLQTNSLISIPITQDNIPEKEEYFQVNITQVEKFPTGTGPSISPRLDSTRISARVVIRESNDPYGVLSLEPQTITVDEIYTTVSLTVKRTGGLFGTISVVVKTVGGGESWTSQIVIATDATSNNTIREILGSRNRETIATSWEDYEVLSETVVFQDGDSEKIVLITILGDDLPEPRESVVVYLTDPQAGARIAEGKVDGGKKGFAVIYIKENDISNGIIGFTEDSKSVTVNEDTAPTFTLRLLRLNAFFGDVTVSWLIKLTEASTAAQDDTLSSQIAVNAGEVNCPAGKSTCSIEISLVNDEIPEEDHSFVVKLTGVGNDAALNQQSLFAHINVEESDFVRGLLQFTPDSRNINVDMAARSVRLRIERSHGQGYRVAATYNTQQLNNNIKMGGVNIYPALDGEDFRGASGTVVFEANQQVIQIVDLSLTPLSASRGLFPKQFYIDLTNPTNGASLRDDWTRAVVRIVDQKELPAWTALTQQLESPMNDSNILQTLGQLDVIAQDDVGENDLSLVEEMLDAILVNGQTREFPTLIKTSALSVFCKLLNPAKKDATRGRSSLATKLEEFAYSFLTDQNCPSSLSPDLISSQCVHAKVSAGRWPLRDIQGFTYQAQRKDSFQVPVNIPPDASASSSECVDFHIIEYNSEQWFAKEQDQLLSSRIISFGIKGRQSSYSNSPAVFTIHTPDRRIATRRAQCVYFDTGVSDWVGPSDICEVTNNLDLGLDDYVQCSCKHLTNYAVIARVNAAGFVGYPVWFYVSCFICIAGLAMAIVAHHSCTLHPMFAASLLMHMCFACLATQICYVVAAFLSPHHILVTTLNEDNYRCIVMGLFMHYFFLAQFTWMMTQAANFWKILILNDEHTDRKYVLFFLLGWGVPVIIIGLFYVITYNVYKYVYEIPYDFIYGDVNNNAEMCFVTNSYAALAGVILPVILILLFVGGVFIQSFQISPQWQAYDDIYRGRYNINEVRTLLGFWATISLSWLFGGLHMAYGQLWMLIVFCIFNIIQGLMAMVLYTFLRNPCIPGPQKSNYSLNGTTSDIAQLSIPRTPMTSAAPSIKGSRASLLNENWEQDSIMAPKSEMLIRRSLPAPGSIYVTPPPPLVLNPAHLEDPDGQDFDDLLYALKTGETYPPSEDSQSIDTDNFSELSSKLDGYEVRRISIADTHL